MNKNKNITNDERKTERLGLRLTPTSLRWLKEVRDTMESVDGYKYTLTEVVEALITWAYTTMPREEDFNNEEAGLSTNNELLEHERKRRGAPESEEDASKKSESETT